MRNYKNFKKYFLWAVSIVAVIIICRWVNSLVQEQNRQEEMAREAKEREAIQTAIEPIEKTLNNGLLTREHSIPMKATVSYDKELQGIGGMGGMSVKLTIDASINDYSESDFREFVFSGAKDFCMTMETMRRIAVEESSDYTLIPGQINVTTHEIYTNDGICLAKTYYDYYRNYYNVWLIGNVEYEGRYSTYSNETYDEQ